MGNCCKTSHRVVVVPQVLPGSAKGSTALPTAKPQASEEGDPSQGNLSDPRRPRGNDPEDAKETREPVTNYFEDSSAPGEVESVDNLSLIAMWEPESRRPPHPLVPPISLDRLKSTVVLTDQQAEAIKKRWSTTKQPGRIRLKLDMLQTEDPASNHPPTPIKSYSIQTSDLPRPHNLLEVARKRSIMSPKTDDQVPIQVRSLGPIPFNSRFLSSGSSGSSFDLPTSRVVDSTPIHMSQIATLSSYCTTSIKTGTEEGAEKARHGSFTQFMNETHLNPREKTGVFQERHTPVRMSSVLNKEKNNGSIRINDYLIIRELGSGSFGKVYEVDKSGQRFAMKEYNKKRLKHKLIGKKRTAFDAVLDEVALLSRVEHPNIVYLHEVIDTPESRKTYLVMELAAKGSLQGMLPMPETQAKKYFAQIVLGVEYLHEVVQVIHRDIKPENILLDAQDNIKISDFGSAQALQKPDDTFTNTPGTPVFQSPEQWGGTAEFRGKPLDIWALGVSLYYMLFNKPPFAARRLSDLQKSIQSEK